MTSVYWNLSDVIHEPNDDDNHSHCLGTMGRKIVKLYRLIIVLLLLNLIYLIPKQCTSLHPVQNLILCIKSNNLRVQTERIVLGVQQHLFLCHFLTVVWPWLDVGDPSHCPQVVWCNWGEVEPFSAMLAPNVLAEYDQPGKISLNSLLSTLRVGGCIRPTTEKGHKTCTTSLISIL